MEKQGLPEPEYEVAGEFVRIVFRRSVPEVVQGDISVIQIDSKSKEKSKEKTLDKVYRLILENRKITTAELSELCGVGENSIYKTVRKLRESGRIVRKGGDKGGEWEIIG